MRFQKVSIMIPTYNQAQYVVRAIESALKQDYPNLEIVVADDHSTDNTRQVVEEYISTLRDARVTYFRNEKNIGILRNYQRTLYLRTTGAWAINLDGDDFFVDSSFISNAIELAQSDSSITLVFGDYCEYSFDSGASIEIVNRALPSVMEGNDFVSRYARNEITWNHNSILYRRDEAVRLGCYWDDDVPRNDWESFLRLAINRRVGYVKTIVAAWVQHDSNETRRLDPAKYLNNYALIDGVAAFALKSGVRQELVAGWTAGMKTNSTRGSVAGFLKDGDIRGALAFLNMVRRLDPALALKALGDGGIWVRGLLASSPRAYAIAKAIFRKARLK